MIFSIGNASYISYLITKSNEPNNPQNKTATDNDTNRVAKIEGTFSGQVLAEGIEVDASGILFDASDFQPPLPYPLAINLAEPGPRATTRLWSSMLEAVLYTDIQQAEKVGKKAGEMVAALPGFMKKSLMYEVPEGPKPAGGGGGSQLQGDGSGLLLEAGGKRDMRPLPPAAKGQRAQGRSLGYQLLYAVKVWFVVLCGGCLSSLCVVV